MIAFDRQGKGVPVVLVHGITESRRSWDPLLPALAATHDVLRVDLRGHGESEVRPPFDVLTMAADIHDVVEAAGMELPVLIGHSLGGVVVTAYASMFGGRGAVNIDQSLDLVAFQNAVGPLRLFLQDPAAFDQTLAAVVDSLRGPLNDAEWDRLQSLRRANREVVLGIWEPVLDLPATDLEQMATSLVEGIKLPYLALHGSDPGAGYVRFLTGLVPTATVEVWDGLGHYPHLVEPERFLHLIATFEAALAAD
jgi:pimeloyl-ACP methyl ester carboxylesterase